MFVSFSTFFEFEDTFSSLQCWSSCFFFEKRIKRNYSKNKANKIYLFHKSSFCFFFLNMQKKSNSINEVFIDNESILKDSKIFFVNLFYMARQTGKVTRTKLKKNQYRGILYIQAGHHNTIVTLANVRGEVLCWSSAGACGFRGKRKATTFAAKKAAEVVAKKSRDFSMNEVKILVTGPGQGRETAIREIFKAGIKVNVIREKTGIPHNGCRPPKKRRV